MKFLVLFLSAAVSLQALSQNKALELALKVDQVARYQGQDFRASVKMKVSRIDDNGKPAKKLRTRQLKVLRKNGEGLDQKFYILFEKPTDIAKTTFLVWKSTKAEDSRWLYLPALDLVKPIAPSDKRTSFVGTSFFYEDISGRNVHNDKHRILPDENGFLVLKGIPKKKGSVEFSSWKAWIDKKTFHPKKIEYYKKGSKPYRRYLSLQEKSIQGFSTTVESSMIDFERKIITEVTVSDVKYRLGLRDRVFSERSLKKIPRKYLR